MQPYIYKDYNSLYTQNKASLIADSFARIEFYSGVNMAMVQYKASGGGSSWAERGLYIEIFLCDIFT